MPASNRLQNMRLIKGNIHDKVQPSTVKEMAANIRKHDDITIYSNISVLTALYLFLYWIVEGKGYQKIERITKFPHSNMHQVFGAIHHYLQDWADSIIVPGSYKSRQEIALNNCRKTEFKSTTLIVDSAPFSLTKRDTFKGKSKHHSFKKNGHAINIQFIITHDHQVVYTGGPYYPKESDAKTREM
jgi:hypothetical protein